MPEQRPSGAQPLVHEPPAQRSEAGDPLRGRQPAAAVRAPVSPEVTLYMDVDQSLSHTSYVYTGLFELARRGTIALRVADPRGGTWGKLGPAHAAVRADVAPAGGHEPIPVVFDLHDKSDLFYRGCLMSCALYFKRSYFQPEMDRLPPELRSRVAPLGFNFPCGSYRSYLPLARAAALQAVRSGPSAAQLRAALRKLWNYARLPALSELELAPAQPKQAVILFQPRLWEQHEVLGDRADDVNEQRVTIVRALKREFGARFVGGLVPTPLARRRHPELLATTPARVRSYLELARKSLIGVYTRGLHHSTGWKLGEYMAASSCVVAEPLRHQTAAPLEPNQHLRWFSSPEECVQACAAILEDPDLQRAMRVAVHGYYARNVAPAARILQCLDQVQQVAASPAGAAPDE